MGMLFSLFSRGFVQFLTTSSKQFEKTTMKQKIQIRRLFKAKHFPRIFFFSSLFGFWPKVAKPSRKPKNTKKKTHRLGDYMRPETFLSNLCLLFLFFFGFLKIFATFGQKPKKTSRKPKKNKKNRKNPKKQKNQRLGDYMRPDISLKSLLFLVFLVFSFFLFFLVFSRFFWFLTKSSKNLEKTKYNKD